MQCCCYIPWVLENTGSFIFKKFENIVYARFVQELLQSRSRFFKVQIFQGPGFSGSRFFRVQLFRVRVQGPVQGPGFGSRVQGPGPGYRSSPSVKVFVLFQLIEGKLTQIWESGNTFVVRSFIKRQTSGTSSDNEWQRMTNDNEWQRMTKSGNKWQEMKTSDNEWKRVTIWASSSFFFK